jgi:putative membrane protein
MRLIVRILIIMAALWVAIRFIEGIEFTGSWLGLLGVALVFGIVNAFLKPLIKLLTCPLVILTLGLFTLVINAFLLWLTGVLSESLGLGFRVDGFWPAFWGGLVISIVSILLSVFLPDRE